MLYEYEQEELIPKGFFAESLVFARFYMENCRPCEIMAPVFAKLAEQYADEKFINFELSAFVDLADEMEVKDVPTVSALYDGFLVAEAVGIFDETTMSQWCQRIRSYVEEQKERIVRVEEAG